MRHLIVGQGEIGKAIYAIFPDAQTLDLEKKAIEYPIEVLHICFPYSEQFVSSVKNYIELYSPEHVIIYSTVPIGTTYDISPLAVHSPCEGKHPELEMSIRMMERWIGYNDDNEKLFFANLFRGVGIKTKAVPNTDFTEALKLLSTTEYGINIEFARYKKHVADSLDMDYQLMKDWNVEYNKLYQNLGMGKRFQKFVLDAPEGSLGGHCVVPNSILLHKQYPSEFTRIVGAMDE